MEPFVFRFPCTCDVMNHPRGHYFKEFTKFLTTSDPDLVCVRVNAVEEPDETVELRDKYSFFSVGHWEVHLQRRQGGPITYVDAAALGIEDATVVGYSTDTALLRIACPKVHIHRNSLKYTGLGVQ